MSSQIANLETISKILSHPTWDFLIAFSFIAICFFYGILSGKNRLIATLFSLYVSGFLFEHFFYLDFLTKDRTILEVFLFRIVVFLVLVTLLTILFNKFISGRKLASSGYAGIKDWWQIFLLSFLETGLLMGFIFQFFPAKGLFKFSPLAETIFASDKMFFWWLTLPLIALFLIGRKHQQSS